MHYYIWLNKVVDVVVVVVVVVELGLCQENINSFFAGGRKSSSVSVQLNFSNFSLWNGMCNSGVFVLTGF